MAQGPREEGEMEPRAQMVLALNWKRDTKMCTDMKECAGCAAGRWQVFRIAVYEVGVRLDAENEEARIEGSGLLKVNERILLQDITDSLSLETVQ